MEGRRSAKARADEVLMLLASAERQGYIGENVSQLQHALQCAEFARDAGKCALHRVRLCRFAFRLAFIFFSLSILVSLGSLPIRATARPPLAFSLSLTHMYVARRRFA